MRRQFFSLSSFWLCVGWILFLSSAPLAQADKNGGDKNNCVCVCACAACSCTTALNIPTSQETAGYASSISLSEGNFVEPEGISTTQSTAGRTINFSLTYNSYNADDSRSEV